MLSLLGGEIGQEVKGRWVEEEESADAPRLQDGWRINRDWTQWSDEYMKCPNNPSLSQEFHYVPSNPVKECKKKGILSQDHAVWNKILE